MSMPCLRTTAGLARRLPLVLLAQAAWAQYRNDDTAALGACAACSGFFIVLVIAIIALNIALLVWVARDAKARGMDNSVVWMVLVMITGLLGLIIYLLSRPKGELVPCPNCGNKRMQISAKCPHCGNA